jgi:hypothetical protein
VAAGLLRGWVWPFGIVVGEGVEVVGMVEGFAGGIWRRRDEGSELVGDMLEEKEKILEFFE